MITPDIIQNENRITSFQSSSITGKPVILFSTSACKAVTTKKAGEIQTPIKM